MPKSNLEKIRTDFFGRDPVLGQKALDMVLEDYGSDAIKILIPGDKTYGTPESQTELRLAKLLAALGPGAVDHLIDVIRKGSWHSGNLATPSFAGLRGNADAEEGLISILKKGSIDPQRHAIEALGYLGSNGWAFDITEFAKTGDWLGEYKGSPSRYCFDKFYTYALQALIRMTKGLDSGKRIVRCLDLFKDLLAAVNEVLGKDRVGIWDIRFVQHYLEARAADPIITEWIDSGDTLLQSAGIDVLGNLRLVRTTSFLQDLMKDEGRDSSVRQMAGVSLSQFSHSTAAAEFANNLVDLESCPGFDWAFSSLYAHDANWSGCDRIVARLLENVDSEISTDAEIAAHLLYSLACRGDNAAERAFTSINSRASHVRGPSALACARYDASRARDMLRGRDAEVADPLELAFFHAAQVHAGDHAKADELNQTLQQIPTLAYLRPIWKREILYAFFVVEGEGSERGRLWCEAALENPDRLLAETKTLVERCSETGETFQSPVNEKAALGDDYAEGKTSETTVESYDVFISHASEDKEEIARPLYSALLDAGVSVWFDEATLKLGDSLRRKIDEGLVRCRYGIVILSPSFLSKEWPQIELNGLVARETASGQKAILPIWHRIGRKHLLQASPTLADRLGVRTSEGLEVVVARVLEVLQD